MAMSNDTEIKTIRIPVLGSPTNRDTIASKDQRFVNAYFDVIQNPVTNTPKYFFVKRPGLSRNIQPSGGAGVGRGLYVWRGDIYTVIGTQLYKNTTNLGVTLTTSTGQCGITETRPGAGTQYLGINDGIRLYLISVAGAVTTITVNFPSPNTTDLVYMDGYFFTMKIDNTIWNCNVDDPTTWDPTKFLTAQMYNGGGVGLAHQNNLLLCFSNAHIQAFYDAANAAGSPLANVEQSAQQVGAVAAGTIVEDESYVTWLGNSQTGGFTVYRMRGTVNQEPIGTPGLERILLAEGANLPLCTAFSIRTGGHFFYVLKLITANRTFVFDHDLKIWYEWEAAGGGAWPIVSVAQSSTYGLLGLHPTNGWVYNITPTVYQDDSSNFTVLAQFGRLDFDDMRRKFVQRVDLVGDVQASSTPVTLQYSDDDYNTLSTGRTMDMAETRPFQTRFSNFRRRAWKLSYSGSNPLRIEGLELKVKLGL